MLAHEQIAKHEVQSTGDRKFGLFFAAVFCALALIPLLHKENLRYPYLLLSFLFLIFAIGAPRYLRPLNILWTKIGLLMARVGNPLIMGIIFFALITPMAILLRILKKDLLSLRLNSGLRSYWIERNPPGPEPETMRYQF